MKLNRANIVLLVVSVLFILSSFGVTTAAEPVKPNIVIIWGDDIGQSNISNHYRQSR